MEKRIELEKRGRPASQVKVICFCGIDGGERPLIIFAPDNAIIHNLAMRFGEATISEGPIPLSSPGHLIASQVPKTNDTLSVK